MENNTTMIVVYCIGVLWFRDLCNKNYIILLLSYSRLTFPWCYFGSKRRANYRSITVPFGWRVWFRHASWTLYLLHIIIFIYYILRSVISEHTAIYGSVIIVIVIIIIFKTFVVGLLKWFSSLVLHETCKICTV